MALTPSDITIVITVYDRREFLEQAINSALNQTIKVRVVVLEDCGPDPTLQAFVKDKFGRRLESVRNPTRRGLFGSFNACLALCQSRYLSILHDDDFLQPNFVESMIELAQQFPGRGLYYGPCNVVDYSGAPRLTVPVPVKSEWHEMNVAQVVFDSPVTFAGQLICVEHARSLGGFKETSQFCGDWDMWLKLAIGFGAAATNQVVATTRDHDTLGRGTSRVVRTGKASAYTNVQRKSNVAMARRAGYSVRFDRQAVQKQFPLAIKFLVREARGFSPRLLAYNVGLCLRSTPRSFSYKVMQSLLRILGPEFVRLISRCYGVLRR